MKRALTTFFTLALLATASPALAQGNGNGNGNAAAQSPTLASATANFVTNQITIVGTGLNGKGTPIVTIGTFPALVLVGTPSATSVVATLPAGITPGTYPLTVTSGNTAGSLDVTLGVTGPMGPQGIQGIQGVQGPVGATGAQGPQGIQGIQGLKGDKGDQGIQGLKGDKGDQGDQGIQGLKGDKGDQGDQGIQGLKGDKGDQGLQGLKGDKGDAGAQGPQGVKGDKGDTGAQGPQGDTGATGTPGAQGPAGAAGQGQTVLIGWDMGNVAEGCYGAVPASDRRPGIHGDMKYRGIANGCGTTVGAFPVVNWASHNATPSYTNPNDYPYLTLATTESMTIQKIRLQSHTNHYTGAVVPMDVWISPATAWGGAVLVPPGAAGLVGAGYTHLGTYNTGNFAQYGMFAVKQVNTSTTVGPGIYHIVLVPQFGIDGYMQFDNLQLIGKILP